MEKMFPNYIATSNIARICKFSNKSELQKEYFPTVRTFSSIFILFYASSFLSYKIKNELCEWRKSSAFMNLDE